MAVYTAFRQNQLAYALLAMVLILFGTLPAPPTESANSRVAIKQMPAILLDKPLLLHLKESWLQAR